MVLGTPTETETRTLSRFLTAEALAEAENILLDARTITVRFKEPINPHVGAPDSTTTVQNRFQKRGRGWLVAFKGEERVYPDTTGFTYIHALLERPDAECSPEDLLRPASVLRVEREQVADALDAELQEAGDLGQLVPEDTLYRIAERLGELKEEADRARRLGDSRRLERIQAEMDSCAEYVRKARRLGGKPRVAGSILDKNRQKVWQAVHRAYEMIAEEDPDLARFLSASIETKSTCRYCPIEPVNWLL